jgi:hypothetical protein
VKDTRAVYSRLAVSAKAKKRLDAEDIQAVLRDRGILVRLTCLSCPKACADLLCTVANSFCAAGL